MKLKRITDEEIERAYRKTVSAWKGLELVAQAQLEACEKEATKRELMWEGYTELTVKQERERILDLLPHIAKRRGFNRTCFDCIGEIKRQTLKEIE